METRLPPEQEHLRHFLRERFHSEVEAASFLGGSDGADALLGPDEFARALRLSGYGRPAEGLFAYHADSQHRLGVKDFCRFIGLPEEPELSPKATPAAPSAIPPSPPPEPVHWLPYPTTPPQATLNLPSVISRAEALAGGQGPMMSPISVISASGSRTPLEATLPATLPNSSNRALAELESELSQVRKEMTVLKQRVSPVGGGGEAPTFKPDEAVLQEAASMRAENADMRTSLTEALRLLADERRERLKDKAEATRRHKELQIWAEDRIRNVEHLSSEGRQCTTEVRVAVQEALQLGELSEFRALGAVAEESRSRELLLQREAQMRETLMSDLESHFRKLLGDERAARFQEAASLQEQLARVEDNLTTERDLHARKMADLSMRIDEAFGTLSGEKDTRQVQLKELAGRQDGLRTTVAESTRELRDIGDDQQRRILNMEHGVEGLAERLEAELKMLKNSMLDLRQQLHGEVFLREESMSQVRNSLDAETRTRSEVVDKNLQLREDVELRLERAFRNLLHEERVARDEALGALEQRAMALQQEVNFEKAKTAAQGRDIAQNMAQLKEVMGMELATRKDEVAFAVKGVQEMHDNMNQGFALRDDAESRLLQKLSAVDSALRGEAASKDVALKQLAEELAEARSFITKEAASREELEGRISRQLDEDKRAVHDSLQKFASREVELEASGFSPERLKAMLQEERQAREKALQRLEGMLQRGEGHMGDERSAREEQAAVLNARLSQIHGELEDVRQRTREALTRFEEIHSLQEVMGREKGERQAEATSTQLSLKELAARLDQFQQAADAKERITAQKLSDVLAAVENEVKDRQTSDADILRQQTASQQDLPAAIFAERQRSEEALAKAEEAFRHEASEERKRREDNIACLEARWQQLREAMEDAFSRRLDQHGEVAQGLAKVAKGLEEESTARQRDVTAVTGDLKRFREEVQNESQNRRRSEEGLHDQVAQVLKRLDQAQETLASQDAELKNYMDELSKGLTSETALRESLCDALRKDLQHDSLAKEEMISGANKSWQRASVKINEEWRSAIRAEMGEREELRARLDQQLVELRQGVNEAKAASDKRDLDLEDRVKRAAESLGDDARTRKERDEHTQQALEQLRRAVTSEGLERGKATEGLAGRLQYLEAALSEEAGTRVESERHTERELVNLKARLQEEKTVREEAVARVNQSLNAEAAARTEAVVRESKVRDEAVAQAMANATKGLKMEQMAREEDTKKLLSRLQQLQLDNQQERDERSRVIRDLNAAVATLQRNLAEEEDARAQESERLGSGVESLQEAVRGLRQNSDENWQRTTEIVDELRASIAKESAMRTSKLEAVDVTARELRTIIANEAQQRQAAIGALADELAKETEVMKDAAGRDRRAIEEDVARAVREHRKGREDEERKMHERLIEMSSAIAAEREQRVEAARVERLRVDEFKEEVLSQRKASQRELDKLAHNLQKSQEAEAMHAKDADSQLKALFKLCEELQGVADAEAQKTEHSFRNLEGKATELEGLLRTEIRERKDLGVGLQQAIVAEASQRDEAVAQERRAREAADLQQDELSKTACQEERGQRQLFMESCTKDIASVKLAMAEEVSRRSDDKSQLGLALHKLRTDLAELQSLRATDIGSVRETCEKLHDELQELGKAQKEDFERIDTTVTALVAKTDSTARIAREQAVNIAGAVQGLQEDIVREGEERGEALRRLEAKLGEERRQLEAAAGAQARSAEQAVHSSEDATKQKIMEESRKSKALIDKLSTQISALAEDVDKARALQPEQSKDLARNLAQLQRQLSAEEIGRQQAIITLQRSIDAMHDELLGETRDRRQHLAATSDEVTALARSLQQRDDKADVLHQQVGSELADLRERLSKEVRARESALLQLEGRAMGSRHSAAGAEAAYPQAVPGRQSSTEAGSMAVTMERWRQAEEEMERTKSSLASLKAEAFSISKAMAGLDERCESVRAAMGVVQSGLAEVQQKQGRSAEVEALVAQAREELRRESAERKAEGSQLSTKLVESAERLEWAEQQRLKAESAMLQDIMDAKNELKRETRDREEGQAKVIIMLREESSRREDALEKEARLRLEGEERAAQALQAAIREERRLRGQAELRLEDRALAALPGPSADRSGTAGALMSIASTAAAEEQLRLKQKMMELQTRLATSEARQKSAEERTVTMLDAIMNGLMPPQA
eukprot:TRINITY_DN5298_c0_g3_i1.p1 TRINITY_DN5298_c0_g3~~TRINITY_DN5298_c0_g3_i1.p1  ORF type:complete len:2213 (-),score=650.15 TRINITY_DN5298_c0_g3_i1:79-6645(-)